MGPTGMSANWKSLKRCVHCLTVGPLHDLVTWYKVHHAGRWEVVECNINKKEMSAIQMLIQLFFDVLLRHLPSCRAGFVPCDQILQSAYRSTQEN